MANERARSLRKRLTDHERILWTRLRRFKTIGFHFRRQHPIGPFVVDFACISAGLIVELDGSQHGWSRALKFDHARDAFLRDQEFTVHRISNSEVRENLDGVILYIYGILKERLPRVAEAYQRDLESAQRSQIEVFLNRLRVK